MIKMIMRHQNQVSRVSLFELVRININHFATAQFDRRMAQPFDIRQHIFLLLFWGRNARAYCLPD